MVRYVKVIAAAGLALLMAATPAMAQDAAAALRATGQVGEQADGYMGLVGSAPAEIRAQMDSINIQRRAVYTQLASQRSATIEEVAAAASCQIFRTRIQPNQYYRLTDNIWRQRNGSEPVPLPGHCG